MRISFDIDDTLVCSARVPAEQPLARWRRFWYSERLRAGTTELMRELIRMRCEVWFYTTSYRTPRYLTGWFRCLGVPIAGVVNQDLHDRVVGRRGPSKYPPAFGIDLHVDDSEGVGMEGRQHGFAVVVVAPEDRDWVGRVLAAVATSPA